MKSGAGDPLKLFGWVLCALTSCILIHFLRLQTAENLGADQVISYAIDDLLASGTKSWKDNADQLVNQSISGANPE